MRTKSDSDVDIMILLDITDTDLKAYSQNLSYIIYDFNLDHGLDIIFIPNPIRKNMIGCGGIQKRKQMFNWEDSNDGQMTE